MVGSGTCAGGGDIGADIALWCCGAVGVVLGVGASYLRPSPQHRS